MSGEPGDTTGAAPPAFTHRQILVIFSGLVLGLVLAAIDQTIVATALPTITEDLGGLNHLAWVVTSYLLASTVAMPLYGKLGDLYGRKHLFQLSIALFLLGSVACGLAQSMTQLILFRAAQGIGGGGLIVLAQSIIGDVVSPRERGRYQGYLGAVFGAASVTGPLLGGFLTDHFSWRWVFYVNVPFGIAAVIVTSIVLPPSVRRPGARIDYAGALLISTGATCVVLFSTWGGQEYAWTSPVIVGLILAAAASFAALVFAERRAAAPMLPIRLFKLQVFRVSVTVSFILGVAMYGAIAFLPLFLQVVTNASATDSGLLLVPLLLGLIGASIVSGQVISRTGRYKMFPVAGALLVTVALLLLGLMDAHTSEATGIAFMVILGVGIGSSMQTLLLAVQNVVPREDLGSGTSAPNFFRALGGSIGVAVFGTIFNTGLATRLSKTAITVKAGSSLDISAVAALAPGDRAIFNDAFAAALTRAFLVTVPLAVIAFILTLLIKEVPLRTTVHTGGINAAGTEAVPAPALH